MNAPKLKASTLEAVGNTPLVQLGKIVPASSAKVLIKLEYFNPTGSYKDRMALGVIEEAEQRGDLHPGMAVVEYTGGSTGSSLAFVCAVKGYPFKVVSSDAYSQEKLRTMQAFGAELTIVPSDGGRITPDLMPRMIAKAQQIADDGNAYFVNQFHNLDVTKGYTSLGREILDQIDGPLDGFCAGIGTAGMFMGVVSVLREGSKAYFVALEPAASFILRDGEPGTHRIEGISNGFMPPLLNKTYYHEAWGIDENEARHMARRLAKEEGIFAGTSTGVNVVGAVKLARHLGAGHTVVTVAVDSGLKYLAGNLYE